MQILIDADGFSDDIVNSVIMWCKDHEVNVENISFREESNIVIAHKLLDAVGSTLWVVQGGMNNTCPDLVARALLSNRGFLLAQSQSYMSMFFDRHYDLSALPEGQNPEKMMDLIFQYPDIFSRSNEGPGTGNWLPVEDGGQYLIVGERPGNKPSVGKKDATFFSVDASSRWLREQMNVIGIPVEHFYWVNAFDRQGIEIDWEFVDRLKPNKIFALGAVASASLSKANIAHEAFTHPQYWKRFKSKQEYPFITRLRELNET